MIDRAYTKAEARYIPNGPDSTADMAHPTRTGDLVVFSYPPYQFDAATPGTLVARSAFFGQHGYVPDVKDLAANVNMRATFLAGGAGIAKGQVRARTIDLAPTLAFILGIPEPQQSQGRVLTERGEGRPELQAGLDRRADRLPRPARADDVHHRRHATSRSAARPSWPRCSTRSSRRCPGRACSWPRATTSAPRRRTPGCSRTCRRSTSRTPGASTPPRSATTSSTTGSPACSSTSPGPTSRSWPPTSSRTRPGSCRPGCSRPRSSRSTASTSASSAPS